MDRAKQNVKSADRNPPAIPSIDIAYPAADGIAMALKGRTPRAFIAPKKPTDPPAHASTVVGHYAESALVANAVLVAASGGGGVPAPGDRLDLDPDRARDYLVKHSASMVDWARSSKKNSSALGPRSTTDTSNVDLYGGDIVGSGAKRSVKPVNMDKQIGRPGVVPAPDVRVIDVRDELVHPRSSVARFAPLQPASVALRMAKLRSEREGAPRLCGAADVSPVRPRTLMGSYEFEKQPARIEPSSGALDLVYENLDPQQRRHIPGGGYISTVSRTARENIAKPKWGALDRIYDTAGGYDATHTRGGTTLYAMEKRVDREHVFSGPAMPSHAFIRRTTEGGPGPGDFAGEIIPPLTSRAQHGRSFATAGRR
jgi:hypothetical protein